MHIRIGVAILLFENDRLLLGKRKGPHGGGQWAPPGGHLEFGETPEECAKRELLEETGITLSNMEKGPYVNDFFHKPNKHYVTLYLIAKSTGEKPQILEPDKCTAWEWFQWGDFPSPLFTSFSNLLLEKSKGDFL